MAHVRVHTWCAGTPWHVSRAGYECRKKAEGVFIARRSRVRQENNKNQRDWSCAKFTVAKMSATKGVKFQDTGDGTQNIVTNVEL